MRPRQGVSRRNPRRAGRAGRVPTRPAVFRCLVRPSAFRPGRYRRPRAISARGWRNTPGQAMAPTSAGEGEPHPPPTVLAGIPRRQCTSRPIPAREASVDRPPTTAPLRRARPKSNPNGAGRPHPSLGSDAAARGKVRHPFLLFEGIPAGIGPAGLRPLTSRRGARRRGGRVHRPAVGSRVAASRTAQSDPRGPVTDRSHTRHHRHGTGGSVRSRPGHSPTGRTPGEPAVDADPRLCSRVRWVLWRDNSRRAGQRADGQARGLGAARGGDRRSSGPGGYPRGTGTDQELNSSYPPAQAIDSPRPLGTSTSPAPRSAGRKPSHRANRSCRWWAYHTWRARSLRLRLRDPSIRHLPDGPAGGPARRPRRCGPRPPRAPPRGDRGPRGDTA